MTKQISAVLGAAAINVIDRQPFRNTAAGTDPTVVVEDGFSVGCLVMAHGSAGGFWVSRVPAPLRITDLAAVLRAVPANTLAITFPAMRLPAVGIPPIYRELD